jgi:DNA-binding IclR family transcriptional regulator
VTRAFGVLNAIGDNGPMTLRDVVQHTRLNRSTAYYLLQALLACNAVQIDDVGRYCLGVRLIALGAAASEGLTEIGVAKRYLTELLERINATIVLYQRVSAREIMLVDKLERVSRVRITVPLGARIPIQGGSFGRVFLAHDSRDEIERVLDHGLHAFTAKSVTDVDAFKAEVQLTRERGWAIDHEGFALGVSTVAAPILGHDGRIRLVAAAVTFTSSMTNKLVEEYGAAILDTCNQIGRTLHDMCLSPLSFVPTGVAP